MAANYENIVFANDFNTENITTTALKEVNGKFGKTVSMYINYSGIPGRFFVASPKLRMPFDLNVNKNDDGKLKYSMNLSLQATCDDDAELVANFVAELQKFDDYMRAWGKDNWEQLPCFKKLPGDDLLDDKYKGILKPSKKEGYAPTFKLNLGESSWNERTGIPESEFVAAPLFRIFDAATGEEIAFDPTGASSNFTSMEALTEILPRGSHVEVCFGMRFWTNSTTGYGVTLSAVTLQVAASTFSAAPKGNPFASPSGSTAKKAIAPPPADSDGEDEGEPEDVPEDEGEDSVEDDEEEYE